MGIRKMFNWLFPPENASPSSAELPKYEELLKLEAQKNSAATDELIMAVDKACEEIAERMGK